MTKIQLAHFYPFGFFKVTRRAAKAFMRIMAFLVVMISTSFLPGPAFALGPHNETLVYDTSKCSTDPHDMVYFQMGRRVLRQPKGNLLYVASAGPEFYAALPKPSKPDEPEGCPGHPMQGMGFYFTQFSDVGGTPNPDMEKYALTVPIDLHNNPDEGVTYDQLYGLMCTSYKERVTSYPGLYGCKKPFPCGQDVVFKADDYLFPNGKNFLMMCYVGMSCEGKLSKCDVSYKLYPDLNVSYYFSPIWVPIEDVFKFDTEVRRRINVAIVNDYHWPDEKPSENMEKQK
jgi:hypothetical protein